MSCLIVIPARHGSTRFPGKPLVPLRGALGAEKALIQRSWDAACAVDASARVVVATDDDRIADVASAFGAEVVMTSSDCGNGTERTAEAAAKLGGGFDVVVNFQGDAPLIPPWFVTDIIDGLRADAGAAMATPVLRCDAAALDRLRQDRQAGRVGGTTAVFDGRGRALYFSKEVIPYTGRAFEAHETPPVFHHVGCYAYRPAALSAYMGWPEGGLERWEGLEQLRFLENGAPLACVEVEARGRVFWEVNNPEDVPRVESALARAGLD